jgi:hypothetical protein
MRVRGGYVVVVAAAVALAFGSCSNSKPAKDDAVTLDGRAVDLTTPVLKVTDGGLWVLSAGFKWDICGEQACWVYDNDRHGGPDVFGLMVQGRHFRVLSARLTLTTNCGSQNNLTDGRTSDTGVYFLVQDTTAKNGGCWNGKAAREFNMAAGELVVTVQPAADSSCQGIIGVESVFGHSSGDAGRDVKVVTESGAYRVDWGDSLDRQEFTVIPGTPGNYDCSGAVK